MKTRTIAIAGTSVFGVILVEMVGSQLRLSRQVERLSGELAKSVGENTSKAPAAPTARPGRTSSAEWVGLSEAAQVAALREQVAEMRGEIAELKGRNTPQVVAASDLLTLIPEPFPTQAGPTEERTLESPKRSWGHEQVLGPPNTDQHGDISTAWAPMARDGGSEWLQVGFDSSVPLAEINVHETYNPGAISKVAVMMPDGSERVVWEGEFAGSDAEPGIVERAFQVDQEITADSVRIYMDTSRVSGWNEIDAVELVGADDSRQWATSATASSTYAGR